MKKSLFTDLNETQASMGAELSPCQKYRYALWRRWSATAETNLLVFIGLNPSTADAINDDPTIRRCIGFAKSFGFGGVMMLNVYAFRATKPAVLKKAADPNGPLNDETLRRYGKAASMVLAAWGNHCPYDRQEAVIQLIGRNFHCLGINASGTPKHPLYISKDTKPIPFRRITNG